MSRLVPILLAQHRAIENRVKSIQAAVEARDAARVQLELPAFKAALSAHLKLEDSDLYPGMVALGTELPDPQLASLAGTFASSMKQVSAGLFAMLARYERNIAMEAFAKDWATITGLLASRIRSEEGTLYGLFEAALARKQQVIPRPSSPARDDPRSS